MKNIFKSVIAAALITGFASSCDEDQNLMVVSPQGSFEIITPEAGSSTALSPLTPNNPGVVVSWEAMDYGSPTAITYTVQVAKTGTEFASPVDVATTTNTFVTISSQSLNGAAIASGLIADVQGSVDIRVMSSVGAGGAEPAYSNVVNYLVTPYVTYPYTDLYLIGEATSNGWDNVATNNMFPMFRDASNAKKYHYTGKFNAGQFKLIEKKGNWQPQYGSAGAGVLGSNDGTGSDPSPFVVPAAGYYTFMVDLENNTYTLAPYTATGSTYATIGIIGTSTPNGWNSDVDMTQSSFDPHIWYLNNQFLTSGGEMKFRADDAWSISWGSNTSYSGVGSLGGPNIPIGIAVSGNYNIWFNDLTGEYIYIPVN